VVIADPQRAGFSIYHFPFEIVIWMDGRAWSGRYRSRFWHDIWL